MSRIAVLIPCYNESQTICEVIEAFRRELPNSEIVVCDNCSTDGTAELARNCGATVLVENRQGKGCAVRKMLEEVEADFFVIVDGDSTYPAQAVRLLLEPVEASLVDIITGSRRHSYGNTKIRPLHSFGNRLVAKLISRIFAVNIIDPMSGYRVMNRKVAKSLPLLSKGFEIETEMTIQALDKEFRIAEVEIDYYDRPRGSVSKLRTLRDGRKVILTILGLFRRYQPFAFFSLCSTLFGLMSLAVAAPVIYEYVVYRYIYKIPSAILAASLMITAFIFFLIGMVMETLVKLQKENFKNYKTILELLDRSNGIQEMRIKKQAQIDWLAVPQSGRDGAKQIATTAHFPTDK